MQRYTKKYLPIKGKPEWVTISNSRWPKSRAEKSVIIKKLQQAKLIKVRRAPNKHKVYSNPVVCLIRKTKNKKGRSNWEFGHFAMLQERQKRDKGSGTNAKGFKFNKEVIKNAKKKK